MAKTHSEGQVGRTARLEEIVRGRRRRGDARADARVPSERATERLRHDLGREVADLRLQLEEASLRSDAYLHAGYPDEAAQVVDEQRRLVSRFEDRLRQSVSAAAIEAEAERVLAGVPGVEALSDAPASDAPAPDGDRPRVAPSLVSAAAAALLAMVAIAAPVPDGTQLSSAESASPEGHPDVAALGDPTEDDAIDDAERAWTLPAPGPTNPVPGSPSAAPHAPTPTPTERLVGLLEGLADAAEEAVRDVLEALLQEDPAASTLDAAEDAAEVEPAPPAPVPPSEDPDDDADAGSEPADDRDASDESAEEDSSPEPAGSEGASEDDGSLSDVPAPWES